MEEKTMKKTFITFAAGILALGAVSCDDFLNRPTEDSYTTEQYYKNDTQCEQGVNYLYNSPMHWSFLACDGPSERRMLLMTVLQCAFTAQSEYDMFLRSPSVPFTVRVE